MNNKKVNLFQKELRSIVSILKKKYNPEKVILFGSLLKDSMKNNSDIDLMVIRNTRKNPWARQKEVEKYLKHKVPLDLLVYTPKEIKYRMSIGDLFVKDIVDNGKIIYEKN
ncbi:MAG: nucleotidyltransferase domain-containing protein [Elusimicrobia bacterium]|nr:nucleotidyltransferase domain-containing protein [Candidatus Liberimonas magnetica]